MPEEGNVNLFAVIGAKQIQIELLADQVNALKDQIAGLQMELASRAEDPKPKPEATE